MNHLQEAQDLVDPLEARYLSADPGDLSPIIHLLLAQTHALIAIAQRLDRIGRAL